MTPSRPSRCSVSATPGRQTSKASTSYVGRAAASGTVASPTPDPISTTSGACRPNQDATSTSGSSTAASGTTYASAYCSQAACCRLENRLPRRA